MHLPHALDSSDAHDRTGRVDALERLTASQRRLLAAWFPRLTVTQDLSWDLVETTVLRCLSAAGERVVVKAGGASDHHIAREIHAHRHWTTPWSEQGRVPLLLRHDEDAKLLVTTYLPGRLVLGSPAADEPGVYRQAGGLLASFHAQSSVLDDSYESRENARSLTWLDGPHRIERAVVDMLRAEVDSWPTPTARLVPTHGDWQPRNWLVHDGQVSAIDLGRAGLRPAMSDIARLEAQDFRRRPVLEDAFWDGYGADPREPDAWHRVRVREAIGTVAWAFRVGDAAFEAQGHQMIAEVLREVGR